MVVGGLPTGCAAAVFPSGCQVANTTSLAHSLAPVPRQDILRTLLAERGTLSLEYLRTMSTDEVKAELSRCANVCVGELLFCSFPLCACAYGHVQLWAHGGTHV